MQKPDVDPRALHDLVARVFPDPGDATITRMPEGVSTQVYQIERTGERFYLRLAEEREDFLAADVHVHNLLVARGVRVPEIVHYEPFDETLQRSVSITTEIPGHSLAGHHAGVDVAAVLVVAGRDLAKLNELTVDGFGWIRRDRPVVDRLEAERPTLRAFVLDTLDEDLIALATIAPAAAVARVRAVLAHHETWLDDPDARLAHGDFDSTHIYHQDGRYTGIIDFGEVRGADRRYDLGHFALHDGERLPTLGLTHLIEGYRQVWPLTVEDDARIWFWSILIGLRLLARTKGRASAHHQARWVEAIGRALDQLSG